MTIKNRFEDFFYKKIVRPILLLSKLGRTSVFGNADSGLNFDHMYRKKPKGITVFGKFVDKVLLNLPSVEATRHRKDIIIKILQNEIANNIVEGKKTKIVDIASGPARYVTELITNSNQEEIEVLCLDRDRRSLNFGKVLAGKKPIRYARADVSKTEKLSKLSKRVSWEPNVVISSGLFEYLDDNVVKKILKDIYENLEKGGIIVFITQKSNPSKKLMSKVCHTQDGSSWELIYRDPEKIRIWLIESGFKAVLVSVDSWGMYEFCTGRKY